ncbi:uncharacterized protein LOC106669576 isoform X2 [Cimex lectularius]|uniref:Uncharacterized protein n=1 Tax=Cimex lectularius TaxID=79782 RepID=A0A8I6RY26_CIMLE|nr:uncharacterized protein LOC106669576 isoform X2 [Cimex lectularius]
MRSFTFCVEGRMAIAEVVPKKEGEGTGTATEASIASTIRSYDKVLRSAPKRTYSKLKSFNFSVPEGWSNDDIAVFFDSCKKHLEDLKNNTEDDLKWSNIAKSGAAASLNPSCFTVNQCIELGQSVDAYIKKYKEILKNDEVFKQLCCDVKEILPHFTSSVSETKRMRRCSRSKSAEETNSQAKESVLEMYIISIGKQHLNLFTTKGSHTPHVWKLISKKVKEKTNINVDVEKHLEMTKMKIINEVKSEADPIRKEQLFLELTKNYLEFFDYIPPKSIKKSEFVQTRMDLVEDETFQEDVQDEVLSDSDKNGERKKIFRRQRKTKLDVQEPSVGADVPVNLTPPEKSCFSAKNHNEGKVQHAGIQYMPTPERELDENAREESNTNQVNTISIDEAQTSPIRKYMRSSTVDESIPVESPGNLMEKNEDDNNTSSEIKIDTLPKRKIMNDNQKEVISVHSNPSNFDEPEASPAENKDLMSQEDMETPVKGRRKKAIPMRVKENPDGLEEGSVDLKSTEERDDQIDPEDAEKESTEKHKNRDSESSSNLHLKTAEKEIKETSEFDEKETTESRKSQDVNDEGEEVVKKRKRTKGNFVKGWPDNDVLLFVDICKKNVDILKNGGNDRWNAIADWCSKLSQNPDCFNKESCAALAFRIKVQLKNPKKVVNCRKESQMKLYDLAFDLLPYFQNDDPKNDFALKENAENLKKASEITKEKGDEESVVQDSPAPKVKRKRTRQLVLSPSRIMPKRNVKDQETASAKETTQLSEEENDKIVHNIKNSFVLLTKCDEMERIMDKESPPVNLDIHLCETLSELPVKVSKEERLKKKRGRPKLDNSQKLESHKGERVDSGEKSPEPKVPTKVRRFNKSQEPEMLERPTKPMRKHMQKDKDHHSARKEPEEIKEIEMNDYGKTLKKNSSKIVEFLFKESPYRDELTSSTPRSNLREPYLPKSNLEVHFHKEGNSSVNVLREKEIRSPEVRPERTFNKYINREAYDNTPPSLKKKIEDFVDHEVRKNEEERNRLLGPYKVKYCDRYEPKSTHHFQDKDDYRRSLPSTSHSFNIDEPKRIPNRSHERFYPLPSQNNYRSDLKMKELTRYRRDYDRFELADRFQRHPEQHCHNYEDFEIALGTAPPKWFQRFAKEYKSHEEWRLHQLIKMQQEHIIVEKQKIDILNKILDRLERVDEQ